MKVYNKLVRDKIPNIIKAEGRNVKTKVLNDKEYKYELNRKLQEEVKEYLEENNVEELVDIVEVIYGILNSMGISCEEFENIRKEKKQRRGAFQEKILLVETE